MTSWFHAEVLPTWASHLGQNTVLEDDVVFLHEQERQQVAKGQHLTPPLHTQLACALNLGFI